MARKAKGFDIDVEATHFLNVDLEVESAEPLEVLAAALGKRFRIHHSGPVGRRKHGVYGSLRSSHGKTADRLTRELCALVEHLPKAARALWNRARSRHFDVGVQSGWKVRSHAVHLEPRTIALVAKVGGSIVITTYAPERATER